jgi:hypothetical protein
MALRRQALLAHPAAPAAAMAAQAGIHDADAREAAAVGASLSRLPAELAPFEAYLSRARELFARIEADLEADPGAEEGRGRLAAMVDDLVDDLATVGAPGHLGEALRRLASALRGSGDPRAALAAALQAFVDCAPTTPSPPLPESRRRWWR